jgi:1,4-dihydroxy-2-naphthoyl-CoA hydrolase
MIWKREFTLDMLNFAAKDTLVSHLGIVCTKIGDDYLEATMPVDTRTIQPMGLLHGGASAALAETLGSVASAFCLDNQRLYSVVGIELQASHLRAVKKGYVLGRVKPIKLGKKLHNWSIQIFDEQNKLCCDAKLTTMVIKNHS